MDDYTKAFFFSILIFFSILTQIILFLLIFFVTVGVVFELSNEYNSNGENILFSLMLYIPYAFLGLFCIIYSYILGLYFRDFDEENTYKPPKKILKRTFILFIWSIITIIFFIIIEKIDWLFWFIIVISSISIMSNLFFYFWFNKNFKKKKYSEIILSKFSLFILFMGSFILSYVSFSAFQIAHMSKLLAFLYPIISITSVIAIYSTTFNIFFDKTSANIKFVKVLSIIIWLIMTTILLKINWWFWLMIIFIGYALIYEVISYYKIRQKMM
jgi:hypothetical protein